jgi:hypothetical protein
MAKGVYFTCPKCQKLHFVTFPQVKKHHKSKTPIVFDGGCSLPPNQVFDELTKIITKEFRKRYPDLPE